MKKDKMSLIYNTLHRKLKIELSNTNPTKHRWRKPEYTENTMYSIEDIFIAGGNRSVGTKTAILP
jgi:hypothetical protein